jgi:hypothetical protein
LLGCYHASHFSELNLRDFAAALLPTSEHSAFSVSLSAFALQIPLFGWNPPLLGPLDSALVFWKIVLVLVSPSCVSDQVFVFGPLCA